MWCAEQATARAVPRGGAGHMVPWELETRVIPSLTYHTGYLMGQAQKWLRTESPHCLVTPQAASGKDQSPGQG